MEQRVVIWIIILPICTDKIDFIYLILLLHGATKAE